MKIIITGSLGHISNPLAQELVQKGHAVTVISSNSPLSPLSLELSVASLRIQE